MHDEPARRGTRVALIFLGLFFTFNLVPEILQMLPVLGELVGIGWAALWAALMPVLGNAALGMEAPIVVEPTGSGDMTWHYVQALWLAIAAAIAALAWVRIDRAGRHDVLAHAWLRVLVRHGLALTMFSYGVAKLVGNQFQPPGPENLTAAIGDASPMGLLWNFMGHSPAYCWFTGLAEILGGALLLSRRTATLGALVSAAVMANVVALNFCYDVPVKLYSSRLLVMAIFLAAHDTGRLLDVLVRNRPAPAADLTLPTFGPRMRIVRRVAKLGLLLVIFGSAAEQALAVAEIEAFKNPSPLRGVYEVEDFLAGGVPLDAGDPRRWRQLVIGEYPYAIVRTRRAPQHLGFEHDRDAATIALTLRDDARTKYTLDVETRDGGELRLRGRFGDAAIEARMTKVDTDAMLLVTRGFHWIQERPFNR